MVSVLIITHDHVGQTLLDVVKQAFTTLSLPVRALPIYPDSEPKLCVSKAREMIEELNDGDGVIVFVDIFGATPSNIAQQLVTDDVFVIHGLSLPMLFRVFNYPNLSLNELVDKAIAAGHDGIMHQP